MAHDRRQSGLWNRNPETGVYEQVPIPTAQIQPKGPYQYYEPPPRGYEVPRRSFSDRSANPKPNPNDEPLVPATNGAIVHSESRKQRGIDAAKEATQKLPDPIRDDLNQHPDSTSDHLPKTKRVTEARLQGSATRQPPFRGDSDYVPSNIRAKAWSPDVVSPGTRTQAQPSYFPPQKSRQTSNASSISESVRRGSVPDRSPLQSLESWSKEEKRARVEQAEHKARQRSLAGAETPKGEGQVLRSGTLRSEKERVVSDSATRLPSQRNARREERRQVSDPVSPDPLSTAEKFHTATAALRDGSAQQNGPPKQAEVQPGLGHSASTRTSQASRDVRANDAVQRSRSDAAPRGSTGPERSKSAKYRARDAGFAGAAAAYNTGPSFADHDASAAAERGRVAYERRKASMPYNAPESRVSPTSPEGDRGSAGVGSTGSRRVQKRTQPSDEYTARNQLQTDRAGGTGSRSDRKAANAFQQPDPIPPRSVHNPSNDLVKYSIPPQTAGGQQAREQVQFGAENPHVAETGTHHRFNDLFHRSGHEPRAYQPASKPLEDWRSARTARLTAQDLDFDHGVAAAPRSDQHDAWWDKSHRRTSSGGSRTATSMPQYDGPYEEQANGFQPRLFLKCGPLLRYTGIRREAASQSRSGRSDSFVEKEIWRGSVMIVTEDDQSDLHSSPVLRLFAQPMDLQQPPSWEMLQTGQEMPPEYEDPIAGQVKVSRTGRALYVRPVHDLPGDVDLSRRENNNGLYAATRTPVLGPQTSVGPDGRQSQHITFQDKSRIKKRDGERAGRYREVKAVRLHTERRFTFWRFNIEVELSSKQYRVAYRINNGPAIGFWVPARGETMNIMFHSCNGFSLSVDPTNFSGPDPLWRDVLNRHQSRPFHVMIGGGDQIYNDAAMRDTQLFREWLQTKNPEHKHSADFSLELQDELEEFYFHRYAMWFSQGLFGMANSQIPMVNLWDDHDIIDGYGSYPHHFMSTRVFTGLGAVAFKYYMLFQHQSLAAETEKEEPSWLLGKSPGPYINELSRSVFMSLGNKVAFLGLDCRTERMRDEVLSQATYDEVFERCRAEIFKGQTKHLMVLLGVPIAYPRLNFLENILTSRFMDPIKAIGRTGALGGFVNKFDGGVEILDDLDDHWTAKHHKAERNWFIQELQELAAEKSVRVTILGGDVHLGAIGQFYSNKRLGLAKDQDHRYMPNVISSAIVNTPPPVMMADVINKRNKVHHLDDETDEDMIPMFGHDVDGSRRNNSHLLPRRNFCIISEYFPGSTRPNTPVQERIEPGTPASATFGDEMLEQREPRDRRFPPGSMKRTMSLTRAPANLVRRLSGSSKSRNPPVSLPLEHAQPYDAHHAGQQPVPSAMKRANSLGGPRSDFRPSEDAVSRPTFHRRPTDFSIKEARKAAKAAELGGNLDGRQPGHVDLEGGLDVSLCMEVDQHDPSGRTVPYRLLVPALWYEGSGNPNPERFKSQRGSLMRRLRWNRKREAHTDGEDEDGVWSGSEGSRTPSPDSATKMNTEMNAAPNAMGLTGTGRGAYRPNTKVEAPPGAPQRASMDVNGTNGYAVGARNATPRTMSGGSGYGANAAPPHHHPVNAYNRGYNMSSPPIGDFSAHPTPHTTQAVPGSASERYPQSGYRRTSAPLPSTQSRSMPPQNARTGNGTYDGYDSEGSLTSSEFYDDDELDERRANVPVRRGNKVEEFFGFGKGPGSQRRPVQQERPAQVGETGEMGRSKSVSKGGGWKIWK
ncbi:Hypothetical predicted protein [Lecanosticta acicola]|uniref:PhoD-like phosphatase domain-containing protein n=1 Tax=Lecanosticta acicola TaxID=111012 RepID=A0AAI8Z3V3_9PEZI|nr:Hypothetical predicted protein [Lecanosticta acicola]